MQVGTDIIEISRITQAAAVKLRFPERILTETELVVYQNYEPIRQASYLAGRFAAKEAYGKALGTGVGSRLRFTDIEVTADDRGVPTVTKGPFTHPQAKVSISHSRDYATATVIVNIDEPALSQQLNQYFTQKKENHSHGIQ